MSNLLRVVLVISGFVLCGVVIDVEVVAGRRFLGSGRARDVGRWIAMAFCCGDVLFGKRVIV